MMRLTVSFRVGKEFYMGGVTEVPKRQVMRLAILSDG